MAAYSFYCCSQDGLSNYFEVRDVSDVHAAAVAARNLLNEHRSASYVTVAKADTEILRVAKEAAKPTWSFPLEDALTSLAPPGLAVIVTSPDGIVRYWNEAAVRLYGWRIDEAVGRDILDLTPARQSHRDASIIMSSLAVGQPWQGGIVLRRRDGVPFEAFVADFAVSIVEQQFIVGLSVPLSQRRLIDRQRAELEDNLRAALEGR